MGTRIFILLFSTVIGCTTSFRDEAPLKLTGKWHRIHEQDTIGSLAAMYGVDKEMLAELNDVEGDRDLSEREEIFIPMHRGKAPGVAPSSSATSARKKSSIAVKSIVTPKAVGGDETSCETTGNPCLAWPLDGKLGSVFGAKDTKPHDGIDILAEKGALVRAAASGEVLYSGAQIKGYGNLVILRHKDGILTIYAHNDKNLVTEGAQVEAGAVIAEAGQSGNAAVVHVHFEVRVAEVPKNPLDYLPPRMK